MRISDWSSDVCSSDLASCPRGKRRTSMCGALRVLSAGSVATEGPREGKSRSKVKSTIKCKHCNADSCTNLAFLAAAHGCFPSSSRRVRRSEEHTSELQSLMRISYAVFCLKKKKKLQ